jgi:hypothetical protein
MSLLPKATAKTDVRFTTMQQTKQQANVVFCWVKQRKCEVCGKHNRETKKTIKARKTTITTLTEAIKTKSQMATFTLF